MSLKSLTFEMFRVLCSVFKESVNYLDICLKTYKTFRLHNAEH